MRELIKLTNEDYDITLSEGKVVVGPKVLITEDEKGKALNEPYNEVQEELSFKSLEDFSDYIQRQLNLVLKKYYG